MRKALVLTMLLFAAGIAAGCKVWDGTKGFFKAVAEATEPEYYWTRQKVAEDSGQDPTRDDSTAQLSDGKTEPMETLMPFDVARAIPKDHRRGLDSLKAIDPSACERRAILKSDNGEWNRELFYALHEDESITLEVEGPKMVMVLSMFSVNRDEALDNLRKYIYSYEDETGKIREEPAYSFRRKDILFEHTESESASTLHVCVIRVPEGKHTYTFRFRYSDGGDILLKFFEAIYP